MELYITVVDDLGNKLDFSNDEIKQDDICEAFNELRSESGEVEFNSEVDVDDLEVVEVNGDFQGVIELEKYIGSIAEAQKAYNGIKYFDSLKDMALSLDDNSSLEYLSWYEFDEYFFNDFFSSPYDAARATFFGDVNWNDNYARLDVYENIETTNDIDYEDEADEIVGTWAEENL